MAFKVIIASGKDFNDANLLTEKLDFYLQSKQPDIEIVTGFSLTSDALAKQYAAQKQYPVKHFPGGFRHMAAMIRYSNAAIIFHDGRSKGADQLIRDCKDANVNTKVITYAPSVKPDKRSSSRSRQNDPLSDIIPTGRPRKRKISPIIVEGVELKPDAPKKKYKPATTGQTVYKHDYKAIYLAAHKAWFEKEYPSCTKDGHYQPKKVPAVDTANGMASYIIDHAAWTGNYANRINVMGRQVGGFTKTQSGKVFDDRRFIKASTKKGSEDVDLILSGTPVKIEIKIAGDVQSKKQEGHQAKVTRAGGHYFIIKSIDDYIDIFNRFTAKRTLFDP